MATDTEQPAPSFVQALIVDGNATSRSVLVSQLRQYGVSRIVQCTRVQDARARLEHTVFDYVLCEQYFGEDGYSGQTLLDDLRRAQLLPFSTVFFMVTTEASYAAVTEAAESALDGYLLKPFTPSALYERLTLARLRKTQLREIFLAIERDDLAQAAKLCIERFKSRQPYWLYTARMGSELLLRLGRHADAAALFRDVISARPLPWAKLGVARAQIEAGQASRALSTLQALRAEDPAFADVYDVMGRAQVELGHFEEARATYRTASELTPDSIVRLQKLGMMSYYLGDRDTALRTLARSSVLGVDSKLFDFQSLVLLAFCYFSDNDRRGIDRCLADFRRILERHQGSLRVQRFAEVAQTLQWIAQRDVTQATQRIRAMAQEVTSSRFDFEAACNLGGLLAVLAASGIPLDEGDALVRTLGMRYANTRGLTELLANACTQHAPYAALIRSCLPLINKTAEDAMAQALAGNADGAVQSLLDEADRTINSKLVDMSHQLLLRLSPHLPRASELQARVEALRERVGSAPARAILGQDDERRPGGVVLRLRAPADGPARIPPPPDDSLSRTVAPSPMIGDPPPRPTNAITERLDGH